MGTSPPGERVLVLLDAQPVERVVGALLLAYALPDRRPVEADGRHAAALCPEPPVPEPAPEVRVPVEHEREALALQVAHEARDAELRRDAGRHVDAVRHEVPLDGLHPLPHAQPPEDLPQVLAVLVADRLPSILWREHDVVLAQPFRVREAAGFLGHSNHLPSRGMMT